MDKQKVAYFLRDSKLIRGILFPIMSFDLWYKKKNFYKTKDAAKIRKYQNLHKGERCFIIGNGPSLTAEDLTKIKDEISFGTNRIYYMFDKTPWRPTYYMCSDNDILFNDIDTIKELKLPVKFLNIKAKKYGRKPENHICYFYLYGPFKINKNKDVQLGVSEDVSKYFSKTRTVTCSCIEMAIYMGFKEIYLLGVDHSYAITQYADGHIEKNANVTNYFKGMNASQSIAIHPIDMATKSYQVCRDYADKHGIHIYNATRGGKLEVFERRNFDKLFEKK